MPECTQKSTIPKAKKQIPVHPERSNVPPVVAQLTAAVPLYPEAQESPVQLAAVTCPGPHPLPL